MEYKVVEEPSSEKLTDKVNELLLLGWEIKGSHQVIKQSDRVTYMAGNLPRNTNVFSLYSQTMIK